MTIRHLKKMLERSKLPDDAEVVVHADSNSRDYIVDKTRVVALGSRYFGGPDRNSSKPGVHDPGRPSSTELECLVLYID